jgi:cobalt-zinc-cadmium efflux system membrane fusion protein
LLCKVAALWLAAALAACQPPHRASRGRLARRSTAAGASASNETPIATTPVEERVIDQFVTAGGKAVFDDARVTHIFSPVSGRVTEIPAVLGAHVVRGDTLAIIESPDVSGALADRDKARADLSAAQHELERQRAMFAAHASSRRDYEIAEDNVAKNRAEMARAAEKVRLLTRMTGARVRESFALTTPIDGEVITRSVTPGMDLQGQYTGGTSPELFTVGSLDPIWVLADVFEQDLARVRIGAPVQIQFVAYPGRTFTGVVDWISGTLDPSTRTAKVRCTLANQDRALKPEMYATVRIQTSGWRTVAVPRSAVLHLGDSTVVYVARSVNGSTRYERRPVVVDENQGGNWVPVLHGLAPGDQVVTAGAILLSSLSD